MKSSQEGPDAAKRSRLAALRSSRIPGLKKNLAAVEAGKWGYPEAAAIIGLYKDAKDFEGLRGFSRSLLARADIRKLDGQDDLIAYMGIVADISLNDDVALLADGESFLKKHPASDMFGAVKMLLDGALARASAGWPPVPPPNEPLSEPPAVLKTDIPSKETLALRVERERFWGKYLASGNFKEVKALLDGALAMARAPRASVPTPDKPSLGLTVNLDVENKRNGFLPITVLVHSGKALESSRGNGSGSINYSDGFSSKSAPVSKEGIDQLRSLIISGDFFTLPATFPASEDDANPLEYRLGIELGEQSHSVSFSISYTEKDRPARVPHAIAQLIYSFWPARVDQDPGFIRFDF